LSRDGRHNATAETLAAITAVHESNITLPEAFRFLFTRELVQQWRDYGYNAVIVNNKGLPMAQGYDMAFLYTHCCESVIVSTDYTLFVATRDHPMIVENRGDGDFLNWAFSDSPTDSWVRYGSLVFFLPSWDNALFGEPRTLRDRAEFPGWFV
jgi:hypothetical protein